MVSRPNSDPLFPEHVASVHPPAAYIGGKRKTKLLYTHRLALAIDGRAPSPDADARHACDFPACTAGANTITHWGVGTGSSGAGYLMYKGALASSISVTTCSRSPLAIARLDIKRLSLSADTMTFVACSNA